jgi:large subunit ribosomal protein L25
VTVDKSEVTSFSPVVDSHPESSADFGGDPKMQESLRATRRVTQGTRASKRLRKTGRVPGVVYGTTVAEPHAVHVDSRELYAVLHTDAGLNAIIEVDVEGEQVLTVAREIQRHPVRRNITHLDFIQVRLDRAIEAEVQIVFIGTPIGVIDEGGLAETVDSQITISALPNAIPRSIEVDISHLGLHDTLTVADLPVLEGVTYEANADDPLLTVVVPAAEEVAPVVEDLEGEGEGEDEEGTASDDDSSSDDEG